jgi:leucyl-tRNA synthetase
VELIDCQVLKKLSCDANKKKFFATFPYHYVNGLLHLGREITTTKVDFISRYYKNKAYNVLFPFAYHGTGAPIFACVKKISEVLISLTYYNSTNMISFLFILRFKKIEC